VKETRRPTHRQTPPSRVSYLALSPVAVAVHRLLQQQQQQLPNLFFLLLVVRCFAPFSNVHQTFGSLRRSVGVFAVQCSGVTTLHNDSTREEERRDINTRRDETWMKQIFSCRNTSRPKMDTHATRGRQWTEENGE